MVPFEEFPTLSFAGRTDYSIYYILIILYTVYKSYKEHNKRANKAPNRHQPTIISPTNTPNHSLLPEKGSDPPSSHLLPEAATEAVSATAGVVVCGLTSGFVESVFFASEPRSC